MFQGSLEDVSRKFYGNFEGVSRKCQVTLKGIRSSYKAI